jgi:hypothetical protein
MSPETFGFCFAWLGVRTRCHGGRVSCSLQDEALDGVLGDARADEAAVRARRIMGVCLLRLVVWLLEDDVCGILAGGSAQVGGNMDEDRMLSLFGRWSCLQFLNLQIISIIPLIAQLEERKTVIDLFRELVILRSLVRSRVRGFFSFLAIH